MCLGCAEHSATIAGNLCEDCADELSSAVVPEQIVASSDSRTQAALLDQWGRPHYLDESATLGRQAGRGVLVLDGSVSREHAKLERGDSSWEISDLESTNGTIVNGTRVRRREIESRDRIRVGVVSFVFITPTDDIRDPSAEISTETLKPDADVVVPTLHRRRTREQTQPGLPTARMLFREPTGGGGGLVTIGSTTVLLPITQFEFVELLTLRMHHEHHKPDSVRGYVRYSELLTEISWNTAHPSDNHVKQLVRRVRKGLIASGLPNLIESRRHFGYRLCVIPIIDR